VPVQGCTLPYMKKLTSLGLQLYSSVSLLGFETGYIQNKVLDLCRENSVTKVESFAVFGEYHLFTVEIYLTFVGLVLEEGFPILRGNLLCCLCSMANQPVAAMINLSLHKESNNFRRT